MSLARFNQKKIQLRHDQKLFFQLSPLNRSFKLQLVIADSIFESVSHFLFFGYLFICYTIFIYLTALSEILKSTENQKMIWNGHLWLESLVCYTKLQEYMWYIIFISLFRLSFRPILD